MVEKTEHKLRIGLIGFGAMGRGTAKALTHDDNWDLVAIADVAEAARERAAKAYPDAAIYADPEDIFTDDSIDAVCCATHIDIKHLTHNATIVALCR